MNPIAERIIDGEDVCPAEINKHNATRLLQWIRDDSTHHVAETCTQGKNCIHAPRVEDRDWALFLLKEMSSVCTCEQHLERD